VEDMCSLFHQGVRTLAEDFKRDLGRHYYATPTSYLELIKTYKQLLASKRQQVSGAARVCLPDELDETSMLVCRATCTCLAQLR
jgi:hypothetical protein